MSSPPIEFRDGRLYLARGVYDQYFSGNDAVVLLRDGADLRVLPVSHAGFGGYMIKRRNAAGDRVISGADFFRLNGIGDDWSWMGRFSWCESAAELRLYGMFLM